jgi:D-alanyl-D-alanine carboxypeptidase (penicillin-binding protein 5/6)
MKDLLSALLFFLLLTSANAQTITPPTVNARAWLLLDASSQQVLAAHEADVRIEPASLTKIMTAYLTFSAIRDKRLDLNQTINVSTNAWKVDSGSSKMFIEPDTAVRVTDLLHGLIVQSGNDAAVTLAEAVAGDQAAFIVLMNRQAAQMGLKNTRFANPHGLPDPNNYSTARDLSMLAWRLITDFPEFYKIYSVKSFTYNKISQSNRNRLLWLDETVDGMKTGHTQGAGYCLIASAVRPNGSGQRRLISVVLGADSDNMRAQESQKLLNWGFMNFQSFKIYTKNQAVLTPVVWKGSKDEVRLGFNRDIYVSLPRGSTANLKSVVQRTDPLIAPISQYRQVGTLKVLVDGKVISELPLQSLDQVNEATIFGRVFDSLRLMLPR